MSQCSNGEFRHSLSKMKQWDATVMLVQLEEFKVGCPHESSDFDCQAGYDNWKVG